MAPSARKSESLLTDPTAIPLEDRIRTIRGQRVLLDADLASLYGTTTMRLNQQVRRNRDRFPEDFAWTLKPAEKREVIANCDHLHNLKFTNRLPTAFTEHGALMVANVLKSERAAAMSVLVVRAFVRLRRTVESHRELAERLAEVERRVGDHDESLEALLDAIHRLLEPPPDGEKPRIGFGAGAIEDGTIHT